MILTTACLDASNWASKSKYHKSRKEGIIGTGRTTLPPVVSDCLNPLPHMLWVNVGEMFYLLSV